MFARIMVPLDGSEFGEAALGLAADLARRAGAVLELVSVVEDPRTAQVAGAAVTPLGLEAGMGMPAEASGSMMALMESVRREQMAYLEEIADRLAEAGVREVVTTVLQGLPEGALVERAEEVGAGLVVMCTHGRGAFERAWLGSVADRLVRTLHTPILLVRPGDVDDPERKPPERITRILVPLDGSALAESALGPATDVARLTDASVVLLHVAGPPLPVGSPYSGETAAGAEAQVERESIEGARYLDAAADRLRRDGLSVDEPLVRAGHVAYGVLGTAEEVGADLIAMATHGRGGLRRLLLGSTADKVLRGSRVPVLLVHPASDEAEASAPA